MSDVLIITDKCDLHADIIIEKLDSSKLTPIRLNSEDFNQKCLYNFSWDRHGQACEQSLSLLDSSRSIQDIKVIWWRKPKDYDAHPEVQDPWAIKYCQDEARSFIQSLPGLFPNARWVNNYYNLRQPSRRINQIPLAMKLGINVPATLVTNQYAPIVHFLKSHSDCIIKPMDYSGFLHEGEQYACFTRHINLETVESLRESIHLAPVFIQKRIEKCAEYRVTLIGKKSFVCRIEATHLNDVDVNLDWRATSPDKLNHFEDSLPKEYINKLHEMLRLLGLNFGAFDVIRDNAGDLYFIELNPNGQWYWVEQLTGMPMADAMVKLMEDLANSPTL